MLRAVQQRRFGLRGAGPDCVRCHTRYASALVPCLIAAKYDGSKNRSPGRPPTAKDIRELIVRVARENPTWGYTRLRGALKNLGHELGRNTIKRLLAEHGIAPAPERGRSMSWSTFIKAHWGAIAATDLFTVEVVNPFGLVRYHVLFVIDIALAACASVG